MGAADSEKLSKASDAESGAAPAAKDQQELPEASSVKEIGADIDLFKGNEKDDEFSSSSDDNEADKEHNNNEDSFDEDEYSIPIEDAVENEHLIDFQTYFL